MATRPAPAISPDTEFFWRGLREHKLLIQRCTGCTALRHPPRPMCPGCRSVDWTVAESSGRGTVYSYVMPHQPRFPFFDYPYIVVLVELAEGVRLVSNLGDIDPADVVVGMPVEVYYQTFENDLVLHQFRPGPRSRENLDDRDQYSEMVRRGRRGRADSARDPGHRNSYRRRRDRIAGLHAGASRP
ncbi:hypothetical protein I545_1956 [Mycobacterium kansasii 662]|uniref:Nucleic acid-binding protein n=2 Tax=Mycobacterium kansasii TaxID=1768 RepID=A0A7G1I5Z4_MYCKA|nr:hypothetical protein I545_1956 [Mycobacterium kansasii 662]BCI86401.1 hypothetical protein NIIDMKKI_16070 [Mycobacterium kansasii]